MGRISKASLIKIKLLQHGFTQKDIAKVLNITEAYVSMLIKGKRRNEDFDRWIYANLRMGKIEQ